MVKQQRNSILIAVVLLLFMGAVTELLVAVQRTTQSHDQNAQLNSRANDARAFLERELYSAVFTAVGVSSFLEMRRGVYSEEEMENWLARLYVQSAHLKNIAIAPDNRVRTVYPPDNNRSVIGLYYPDLPNQWPVVQSLMETGSPLLQGPIDLVQGGRGLIYRIPVFIDNAYWGLVSTVIDADSIFNLLHQYSQSNGVGIYIRHRHDANNIPAFWQSGSELMAEKAVQVRMNLLGVEWVVSVTADTQEENTGLIRSIGWTGAIVTALLVFLILLSRYDRLSLRSRVDQGEALLSSMWRMLPDGLLVADRNGCVVRIEDHQEFCLPATQMQGKSLLPLFPASIHAAIQHALANAFERNQVEYLEYESADYGVRIFYEIRVRAIDDHLALLMVRNTTLQKQQAIRLADNESRLRAIIEGTHVGTWEWNVQTGETRFNERWASIAGYRLEELSPVSIATWIALVHPDDQALSEQALEKHFSGEAEYYDCICRMRHKDGHWVWVHDRGRLMSRTDEGLPLMMYGTHTDISVQKQTEAELKESRDQFASLVDNIPGVTYRCLNDADWTMIYMSSEIDRITGYPISDFLNNNVRTYASIIHDEDNLRNAELVNEAIAQNMPWHLRYRIRHISGDERWVYEQGRAIFNEQGQLQYLDGFVFDINDQVRAEQALLNSEKRWRSLFELSPVGILLNEYQSGKILAVNNAFMSFSGYRQEELVGRLYSDIAASGFDEVDQVIRTSLANTEHYGPLEADFAHARGGSYPVSVSGTLADDQDGKKLVWSIVEDITERKRIDRMKSEFVSTVSHELRTPLTSISASLAMVKNGVFGDIPEAANEMITMAYDGSQHLTLLINDLLDMEKLSAGKMVMNLAPLNVRDILQAVLRDLQVYADQFNVRLVLHESDPHLLVMADRQRLVQVLNNILSNAAKFTREGTTVDVRTQVSSNGIILSVEDHGQGITDEFRDKIFTKFSQADSSDTRQRGGTGLGLAICKQLVELMHGEIGFTTVEGQGTTFFVTLPAADQGEPASGY